MVVGVDPGALETGVVVCRAGDRTGELVFGSARTVKRIKGEALPVPDVYFADVVRGMESLIFPVAAQGGMTRLVIGVEMVHAPTFAPRSKFTMIDPGPLIATGEVAAFVLAWWRQRADRVYQVPPGNNGKSPYGSYPDELVTAQERHAKDWRTRQAGQGTLRHERSAFDCARVAERLDRRHRRQG